MRLQKTLTFAFSRRALVIGLFAASVQERSRRLSQRGLRNV